MKKENGSINAAKIIIILGIIVLVFFGMYKLLFEDKSYYTIVNGEIKKSQIENSFTDNDAKQKATILLNAFTNGEYTVDNATLTQFIKDGEPYWEVRDDNYLIRINSFNNKVIYYKDNYDITQIQNEQTEEEAKKALEEILQKYNIPEEYELRLLEKDEFNDCLWYAELCKKENGIFNEYKQVEFNFIPEIKRIIVMTYRDYEYTNNEIKITENEASKIAESIYGEQDIVEIKVERSIEQIINKDVDSQIYLGDELEIVDKSELLEYMEKFKESREIRNAWNVTIQNSYGDIAEYAIDATNGDIIRKAFTRNND